MTTKATRDGSDDPQVLRLRKSAHRARAKAGDAARAGESVKAHQLEGAARLLDDMATLLSRQLRFDFYEDGV